MASLEHAERPEHFASGCLMWDVGQQIVVEVVVDFHQHSMTQRTKVVEEGNNPELRDHIRQGDEG